MEGNALGAEDAENPEGGEEADMVVDAAEDEKLETNESNN